MYLPLIVSLTPLKMALQDYEEYYQFSKMVEKVFHFHQNSIADNMVVVEVDDKIVDNMDYNAEAAKSKAHIVAKALLII